MSEAAQAVPAPSPQPTPATEAPVEAVEASEEGDIEGQAQPAQEPPKPLKKQYKAKVNGKEMSLDLGDDEVVQYIQKAMAADEKFEEASMTRKQVENFIKQLKSDPLAVLRHPELGINIKDLAEKVLLEELREAEKSPEQKKLDEMERKLRDYEEQAKKLESEKRDTELKRIQSEQFKRFDDEIVTALDSTSLPKSGYVVKRIVDTLIEATNLVDENGKQLYPNIKVKDIMPYIEDVVGKELNEMFDSMPSDKFEKIAGKHMNNLRKSRVAKAKTSSVSEIKDTGAKEAPKKEEKQSSKSFDDVFGRF